MYTIGTYYSFQMTVCCPNNLFLVYFVNLYMFRAYLSPSSGGTTVCIRQLVRLFFLDDCLLSWLDFQSNQDNRQSSKNTNCCIHTVVPRDDGLRYPRNMQRLTKYSLLRVRCVSSWFLLTQVQSIQSHMIRTQHNAGNFFVTQVMLVSLYIQATCHKFEYQTRVIRIRDDPDTQVNIN